MTMTTAPKPRDRRPFTATEQEARLPEGAVACLSCGQAVAHPAPGSLSTLSVWPVNASAAAQRGEALAPSELSVGRCEDCAARHARAVALVTVLGLGSIPGTGEVEADRLDAALAALDVIGHRGDSTAPLTRTPGEARDLIATLAHLGGGASWSARVIGGRGFGLCAPRRWAHVSTGQVTEIGAAYRDLFHRRMETPEQIGPPIENGVLPGCGFCGVGALYVRRSDAAAAWGLEVGVQPGQLGGKPTPDLLRCHLCPACRRAVEIVGAPGMPAVERALLAFADDYKPRAPWRVNFPADTRAWAALPLGTAPNRSPWSHLNVAKLRSELIRLEATGVVRHSLPGEPR